MSSGVNASSGQVLPGIDFAGFRREQIGLIDETLSAIRGVLCGGKVLQGPEIQFLEVELARATGRTHAVCVGSGTDALYFALHSVGLKAGDEILVPDISFIASPSAVLRTGAKPVFVDIDESCGMDLERAVEALNPKVKAILYVQLFGGMGDLDQIEAFCRKKGLLLVEDNAQSFGARLGGRAAGGLGSVSILSFDPMKVLSAPGSGGAVLTDDADIADRVRRLRYHGRSGGTSVELGFNSQMPSATAAALAIKLPYQARWTDRRRQIAAAYLRELSDLPVTFPSWPKRVQHVWHKFVLFCDRRDALKDWLGARGIPTLSHYSTPFHREPLFDVQPDSDFPRATAHAATALSLPMHAHLTDEEVAAVIGGVRSFFGR